MKKENYEKIVEYWRVTAERDFDTMQTLFKMKRYPESLFWGHLLLEKVLKGLAAREIKGHPPYTHNLLKLAKLSNIDFSEEEVKFFGEINDFNIRARYPEFKLQFHKICNSAYAAKFIKEINKAYKKLCQELKPKK